MDPTVTHPLFSDAVGVVFRCWVPTSRCRARLTLRSPSPRTRRALFGRHAAADGLRRIISSLAGCVRIAGANSILHSARMILSDVLTCTVPPLRVESSLLKNPIPPKTCSTAPRGKEHARSLPRHLHHLKYDVCLLREGLLAFLHPMHAKRRGVTYSA